MRALSIEGQRFGRLVAVRRIPVTHSEHAIWLFTCDCGKETRAVAKEVKRGHTRSCGCIQKEKRESGNLKHGHACHGKVSTEYTTWQNMVDRCHNPTNSHFKFYGYRGIYVCDRWITDFSTFLSDITASIGLKPSRHHSIDRIENDRGYEPGNIRWATRREQAQNRRSNRVVTLKGERMVLAEASRRTGLNYKTIAGRIDRGWSMEKALTLGARQ